MASTNSANPINEFLEILGTSQKECAVLAAKPDKGEISPSSMSKWKREIDENGWDNFAVKSGQRQDLVGVLKLGFEELDKLAKDKKLSIPNLDDPDTEKRLQEFQNRYFSSITTESNLHCEFISKYYKLLKWRENDGKSMPYEMKQIKTGDVEYKIGVFDECFRWYEIHMSSGISTAIEFDLSSLGHQELINTEPTDIKVDYNLYGSSRSQKISVTVPKNPDARRISLQRSVYNAFQPRFDEVDTTQKNPGRECTIYVKVPKNMSAERISITLDLESIKSIISEMDDPTAQYENPSKDKEPVDPVKSNHASVWTASYENPDPEGALSMQWIMRSRA